MSAKLWVNAGISLSTRRPRYTRRRRYDNREEYVLRVPGFGELYKFMTKEEATKYVESCNNSAFKSAANASKGGYLGYKEFSASGSGGSLGIANVLAGAVFKEVGVNDGGTAKAIK